MSHYFTYEENNKLYEAFLMKFLWRNYVQKDRPEYKEEPKLPTILRLSDIGWSV
jgi:hypothetical protein